MIPKWRQKVKKLNIFLYAIELLFWLKVAMKRVRSSSNGLDSMRFNKEKKNKLAMEIIKEVENELTDIKVNIICNNSYEDVKLLSHINKTFNNLNLIKNEVLKRTVSNESIEYLKELEEDFLDEIYQDVRSPSITSKFNAGDSMIFQEKVNYIEDDFENHPYTF